MNLNKSATETVGLLPHILADLRRSGLSDDTIGAPNRDQGKNYRNNTHAAQWLKLSEPPHN